MELHQLNYFVAVAETGSFSRAAERCHVAQPSLSQQIAKLERELGRRLFDRLGRRVALTDGGRTLLDHARAVLAGVVAIKQEMVEDLDAGGGRLAIGAIPTIAPFVLPSALRRFRQARPRMELVVVENVTTALVEGLLSAELDVCLVSSPLDDSRVQAETLWSEPLVLAVPRDHALARARHVTIADLERYPAIVLHDMHCLAEHIDAFCRGHQLSPNILCRMVQLSTIQSLVALGMGISLVPQACADTDRSGKIAYLPLTRGPLPSRPIVAAWHPLRARSPVMLEFLNLLRAEHSREAAARVAPKAVRRPAESRPAS